MTRELEVRRGTGTHLRLAAGDRVRLSPAGPAPIEGSSTTRRTRSSASAAAPTRRTVSTAAEGAGRPASGPEGVVTGAVA